MRGYGRSDKPRGVASYRTGVLADDVVALVRTFGAERAHVVGHDWGGAVAWRVAMEHPEVVDRLVVINSPHPAVMAKALRRSWDQIKRSWYIFAFQIPWLPERVFLRGDARYLRDTLRRTAAAGTFSDTDLDVYASAFTGPGAATAMLNYYRAAFREALRGDAPSGKISAPTMLIWGEDDFALGRPLTLGMDRLFTAELRIEYVPKTGHWVMEERPDVVNRLLMEFLSA
jgi:pimeloyl-ACP methyl ester carboxylesterase